MSLLCDLNTPERSPVSPTVVGFVAELFHVTREEVTALLDQRLADHERTRLAYLAQREGQPEGDLYGDNAFDDE